jgi:hypothetical protein
MAAPPLKIGGRNYRTDFSRFSRHYFGKDDRASNQFSQAVIAMIPFVGPAFDILGGIITGDGRRFALGTAGLGLDFFMAGVFARRVTTRWAIRRWHQDRARIDEIASIMREAGSSEERIRLWVTEALDRANNRLWRCAPSRDLPLTLPPWRDPNF